MRQNLFSVTFIFLILVLIRLGLSSNIYAVCPVCTIAVGAGLGISRTLGIDDSVTSIWIGGLILSSCLWLIDWIKKKKPRFPIYNFQFPIIGFVYLLVLAPLKLNGAIGIAGNTLFGMDKILLGTAIGSLVFLLGVLSDKEVRRIKGKQLFNFQKIIFPVFFLVIASFTMYFLSKN